jgi:ATP-dependent Clp protease ATP-binding subunit ClpA
MTSNLGKNQLNKFASDLGFTDPDSKDEQNYEKIKEEVLHQVEKTIKPEILGRITAKIVFRPVGRSTLKQIIYKELGELQKHMLKQGKSMSVSDRVVDHLANKAGDQLEYGAREVKGLVAREVQDPVAEYLLDHPKTTKLKLNVKNKQIKVVSQGKSKKSTNESQKQEESKQETEQTEEVKKEG